MITQRRLDAAPAVRAVAEQLPVGTDAVDASIALLTVHHWSDVEAGVAEMTRVARRRVVILTWDALTPKSLLDRGLERLEADLASGAWARRHSDLFDMPQLDLGYRLLVADLELRPESPQSPRR
jgi:ubiquinone/menaquinone biosynthesis C-methylase UbiE